MVPIGRLTERDAVTVATATVIEKNWIALEALGADHRPVDWPAVIGALREIASVPLASADLDPSA